MTEIPLDRDAIRARYEDLEDDAWRTGPTECVNGVDLYRIPIRSQADGKDGEPADVTVAYVEYRTFGWHYPHGDARRLAEFIAHARTDVPALLERVDVVEEENTRLWAMVGRVYELAKAAEAGGTTVRASVLLAALEGAREAAP